MSICVCQFVSDYIMHALQTSTVKFHTKFIFLPMNG